MADPFSTALCDAKKKSWLLSETAAQVCLVVMCCFCPYALGGVENT